MERARDLQAVGESGRVEGRARGEGKEMGRIRERDPLATGESKLFRPDLSRSRDSVDAGHVRTGGDGFTDPEIVVARPGILRWSPVGALRGRYQGDRAVVPPVVGTAAQPVGPGRPENQDGQEQTRHALGSSRPHHGETSHSHVFKLPGPSGRSSPSVPASASTPRRGSRRRTLIGPPGGGQVRPGGRPPGPVGRALALVG